MCIRDSRWGALPKLWDLSFIGNPIGNQGMAALAAPLRKLPALTRLILVMNQTGDEGAASLFANLGKDDFKALQRLWLGANQITDAGMTMLVAAIDTGRLPRLRSDRYGDKEYFLRQNRASASAVQAVELSLIHISEPTRPY